MTELVNQVWLFKGFEYICDFFGQLSSFSADYSVEQILLWLRGEWVGYDLTLRWQNVLTGVVKRTYLSPNIFTSVISVILDVAFWFLPTSVYHMPLYAGVLVASVSWFFVITVVKFVKGIIK